MTEQEVFAILNSDFKLWEKAQTGHIDGGLSKTLNLPWGIGDFTINFAGASNAEERRNQVIMFGELVRSAVKEAIDDEAVTARARAKGPRPVGSNGGEIGGADAESEQSGQKANPVRAEEASKESSEDFGGVLRSRGAYLRDWIATTELQLAKNKRELAGIDAALEVLDGTV